MVSIVSTVFSLYVVCYAKVMQEHTRYWPQREEQRDGIYLGYHFKTSRLHLLA